VVVETGAGLASGHDDEAYRKAGATVESDVRKLYGEADLLVKAAKPRPSRIRRRSRSGPAERGGGAGHLP
jgi:alanine dehydrogenase